MEAVRQQQEESLERREQLLQELEFAHQLTQRDVEEREAVKTERKLELEAQVTYLVQCVCAYRTAVASNGKKQFWMLIHRTAWYCVAHLCMYMYIVCILLHTDLIS